MLVNSQKRTAAIRRLLNHFGLSLHRKANIDRLLREFARLQALAAAAGEPTSEPPLPVATGQREGGATLRADYDKIRAALDWYEDRRRFFLTTEDFDARDKQKKLVDGIRNFGQCDFADLACWIFASSLSNHRIMHQRIDEGASLWRAVKMSGGPILEVGRAAGGSTICILGASGDRDVVSIDRNPTFPALTEQVFSRPDVRRRLTLYTQSSREPIREDQFGMLFLDGDHSYEGVCHDIAEFWNNLRSFDGKSPLAAFHDAAENPIAYVSAVKRACDELIAEPGVARVVETWGAMLVLEKLADIDQERWYAKEDRAAWKRFARPGYAALSPSRIRGRLKPEGGPLRRGSVNLLGSDDLESWIKNGVELELHHLEADNPVRLVRETTQHGVHGLEKQVKVGVASFAVAMFLRPVGLKRLRVAVDGAARTRLAQIDFDLTDTSGMFDAVGSTGIEVLDASFLYENGFFRCELCVAASATVPLATIAVETLDDANARNHVGSPNRGFLMNLASVRELS